MNTVKEILENKGPLVFVNPDTTVLEALKIMADNNIGSVVVESDNGQFHGILSERDYSRKIILKRKSSFDTKVKEIMCTDMPKVSTNDTVEHCMQLMTDNMVRYLPVFEGDELLGIVSIGDVVKATILQQQETIEHLDHYIHSER
jgi:CBS domain-containing protein